MRLKYGTENEKRTCKDETNDCMKPRSLYIELAWNYGPYNLVKFPIIAIGTLLREIKIQYSLNIFVG